MYKNIFKAFAILALSAAVAKADVSLDYTKDGVLRRDNQCNVNFVNFGINDDIKNIRVSKENSMSGQFNLRLAGLKSGNEGLNNKNTGYVFNTNEIKNYVKVTQNGNPVSFDVVDARDGKFSLILKGLRSCEGLTVKQTFKTEVLMNSYLYYSNVKPNGINHAFDIVEFGPSSNNVPYDTLEWDMNKGLDSAREKCRIYIDFHESDWTGGFHWKWYLSTDNINGEKCDNHAFYKAVKPAYKNYDVMEELFGEHYDGYVIKREGSGVGHMDGILVDQKYLIEIYQNGCDEQNKDQVICTISSNKKLSYSEFTKEFVKNCGAVIDDEKEVPEWSVDAKGVYAKFDSYSLNIVNYNRGALPKSSSESVTYKEFKAANSSGIARFSVSTACGNGTYIGDKCKCISCPENCLSCDGPNTCKTCKENTVLENGKCIECPKGNIIEGGKCIECPKGTIVENGKCVECPKGSVVENGKCKECPKNSIVEDYKCKECPKGTIVENGKCVECPKGTETDDGIVCRKIECPKGKELNLESGKCEDIICPKGKELNLESGKCEDIICPKGKELNLESGKCEDIICPKGKELNLESGKCEDIICPKGQELNLEDGKCHDIVCPKGQELNLEDGKCHDIVCPKGEELNLENGKCEEVPATVTEDVGDVTEKDEPTETETSESDNDSDAEEDTTEASDVEEVDAEAETEVDSADEDEATAESSADEDDETTEAAKDETEAEKDQADEADAEKAEATEASADEDEATAEATDDEDDETTEAAKDETEAEKDQADEADAEKAETTEASADEDDAENAEATEASADEVDAEAENKADAETDSADEDAEAEAEAENKADAEAENSAVEEDEKKAFVDKETTPKEEPKKANVTRVVTLKKPKRVTKCIVKKHN